MDRAAAEREALRLWRNLPLQERLTREQAIAFSVMIAPTLEFDVLDRRTRVIEGWLVRDILQTETAALLKEQQERTGEPPLPIKATPGLGANIQFWMLGSSLFGAQLAARLGLPYAFASHFAPDHLDEALAIYRREFQPSAALEQPHCMAAMSVIAGESDAEGELLASSQDQSFVRLRTGEPGKLPPPVPGYLDSLPLSSQAIIQRLSPARAVGGPATVREKILRFAERTGADELILSGAIYDPAARCHSLRLTMDAMRG